MTDKTETRISDTLDGHEYVDLGLPSGTLWATCNVGATKPEEHGDHFAWGETRPKDVYDQNTYKYYDVSNPAKYVGKETFICGSGINYAVGIPTKYMDKDGLNVLQPEDDAATANWGAGWRMPTAEDWQELYHHTTVEWIMRNGVHGVLLTANNGNSLFLPGSGYRYNSSLDYEGSCCCWSSSLNTDYPIGAWGFDFDSNDIGISNDYRCFGRSVRAVRSRQD